MNNKIITIVYLILAGNYIVCSQNIINEKITIKRLDSKDTHPLNIVYSYNQAIDIIKKYPKFSKLPENQQEVDDFLNGPVEEFLDKCNLTFVNVLTMIRQNCMVNSSLFSNDLNEHYADGDTALCVTTRSKNFTDMNQVIAECQKNNIDISKIVTLDIEDNQIKKITAEQLGNFPNLQVFIVHNNKIEFIDITKNSLLRNLSFKKNKLQKGLAIMQKMKNYSEPSYIDFVDNNFDENEYRKIAIFLAVAEDRSNEGRFEACTIYEATNHGKILPFLICSGKKPKDEKGKIEWFKFLHVRLANDENLSELLLYDDGIIKNHTINKKLKISNFRNCFKKHYHKELNYQQRKIKRFLCISLMCKLIKTNHIYNFASKHANLETNAILNVLENLLINKNNNN